MSWKLPLKIYLLVTSCLAAIIILIFYFWVFPVLSEAMMEFSPDQARAIENRNLAVMISSLAFVFLINLGLLLVDKKLESKEKKIQEKLNTNPNDPVVQGKLKKIRRKRWIYIIILGFILFAGLGVIIIFYVYNIIVLLYQGIGNL